MDPDNNNIIRHVLLCALCVCVLSMHANMGLELSSNVAAAQQCRRFVWANGRVYVEQKPRLCLCHIMSYKHRLLKMMNTPNVVTIWIVWAILNSDYLAMHRLLLSAMLFYATMMIQCYIFCRFEFPFCACSGYDYIRVANHIHSTVFKIVGVCIGTGLRETVRHRER